MLLLKASLELSLLYSTTIPGGLRLKLLSYRGGPIGISAALFVFVLPIFSKTICIYACIAQGKAENHMKNNKSHDIKRNKGETLPLETHQNGTHGDRVARGAGALE